MKRLFLSFIIFLFYTNASASEKVACIDNNLAQETYECINDEMNVIESSLNNEYQAAKKRINDVYSGSVKERDEYLRVFTESQRSWLKYRDGDCELASMAAEKNSDASMAYRRICIAELDRERITKIKKVPYG
ncbi:lysozyme inhibitor LprI family protein [Pantoea ananatis]|uniref:lysozyme inhibitor LprI family protein n=1 Tax=Pantoea ananas TaxID=553 RepID=UPI000B7C79A5|nr:lysozyme inhibitor LprI family protein [Pantoea ananatis]